MLKERQKSILDAIIQEYIRTARPVASRDIAQKRKLGISPATVRNVMLELDELGYLEQPYTSAGRIPTDLGYRFFVDYLAPELGLPRREQKLLEEVFELREAEEFVRELSRAAAEFSRTFSAAGLGNNEDIFYEAGFSKIFREPEFNESTSVMRFGELLDTFEKRMRTLFNTFDKEEIFIGKENPIREARPYTMIMAKWRHPGGFDGFLAIVAPRRTNYSKHRALLKSIRDISHG